MKSICTAAFLLIFSIATMAQEKEKGKSKDKEEKGSHSNRDHDEKIKKHEHIIWAGTGIDLNDKSKDVKNIPDAILASFRQYFPDQEIDDVRKYHGLYALTFSNPVYTTTLIYKGDGTFVEARTVATESVVPEIVKEKVKKSKPGYKASEVVLIEKADKHKFYRYHLKKNNEDEYVVYNESGDPVSYDY
jgi:hypothetical protein